MKVIRVYHAGRDAAHRARDRALVRAGVDLTLVVPTSWPGPDEVGDEPFPIISLAVNRAGDVNRHVLAQPRALLEIVQRINPDVLDIHEEPFSSVVHQILRRAVGARLPIVTYAAQNIDKRFPPPFAQWELSALRRIDGVYPCSEQAASVLVGKGFRGEVRVLPLAPPEQIRLGEQTAPADRVRMLLVGRFAPEKGVLDAVRVLGTLAREGDATLTLVGEGPERDPAIALAAELGVRDRLTVLPWLDAAALADRYAEADVLLAPSSATATWVEQFGRMVGEAQAAGAVVVGYASGALPEVVGEAGLLVPEHDVDGLVRAVRTLRDDPAAWTALRRRGLVDAADRTWDAVAAGQAALYDTVRLTSRTRNRPVPNRTRARVQYGAPATVTGGDRPFALPVLRDRPELSRPLARALDAVARAEPGEPPERLRVVFLDHVARMSGGELAMLRLIDAMPTVDAHVILGEDGPLREALLDAGATVEVMELDPSTRELHRDELGGVASVVRTAAYVRRLATRLRELQPDLVHTNSMKSGYYGSVAGRLAGVPVIWHLRDRVADDYLPGPVVKLTRGLLATVPSLVVSNSAETARTAGRRVRAGAVVSSPVIHDPYEPGRPGSWKARVETIGIVGRLAEWKGQDVFLRALADLRTRYPTITGRIVGSAMFGEDAYEARLHTLVTELGLDDAVVFTGFVDNVEAELLKLDVLVHASRVAEPFGQVVVEGMAAGLPVVATDAGGPREIITDGVNGLLVEPDDVESLVAALDRLVEQPELRARLGDAGVIRAHDFRPEVIGAQMVGLYNEVLVQTTGRLTRSPAHLPPIR